MSPWHPDDAYDATSLSREQDAEVVSVEDVLDTLRAEISRVGSQVGWGRRHGIGPGYLADVLSGRRPAGPKVLAALGMRNVTIRSRS